MKMLVSVPINPNIRRITAAIFTAFVAVTVEPQISASADQPTTNPTIVWVTNITVDFAEQHSSVCRQISSLSNAIARLGGYVHQDLVSLDQRLQALDARERSVLSGLEQEREAAQSRHIAISRNMLFAEYLAHSAAHDVQLLSSRVSATTHDIRDSQALMACDLDDLELIVMVVVLSGTGIGIVLLLLNLYAHRHMGRSNTLGPGPSKTIRANPAPLAPPIQNAGAVSQKHIGLFSKTSLSPTACLAPILDPKTLLGQILEEAARRCVPHPIPSVILNTRSVAAFSTKGHVRADNQDYHLGFMIDDRSVVVIGDGCGASSHGGHASYVAVRSAALFLIQSLAMDVRRDIVVLVREALLHASEALSKSATAADPPIQDGFRTTLIVVIADRRRFAFAYIGDGGGVVVRKSRRIEKFLFAQKAAEDLPNVITGSLGPCMEGEPSSGAIPRYPGDLLIVGSDGVWDFVGEEFPLAVAQALAKHGGDATATTESVVTQLADATDDFGHICSDNLTLGLIAGYLPAPASPTAASAATHSCPPVSGEKP